MGVMNNQPSVENYISPVIVGLFLCPKTLTLALPKPIMIIRKLVRSHLLGNLEREMITNISNTQDFFDDSDITLSFEFRHSVRLQEFGSS